MTTRNASSSGQGGNNGNHGNSAPRNGRGGNVTYANPFDSDSDSDAYSMYTPTSLTHRHFEAMFWHCRLR